MGRESDPAAGVYGAQDHSTTEPQSHRETEKLRVNFFNTEVTGYHGVNPLDLQRTGGIGHPPGTYLLFLVEDFVIGAYQAAFIVAGFDVAEMDVFG